jgi:uncharacterized protein YndB with AHSA1/START domain
LAHDSFSVSEVIPAAPDRIYSAWLDAALHSAFTGDAATIEPFVGGRHTAFDGYAEGTTIELVPGRRIVQTWRSKEFPDGSPDSRVEITLEETLGGTVVTIMHSEVPSGHAEQYRDGWVKYYLEPLKTFFDDDDDDEHDHGHGHGHGHGHEHDHHDHDHDHEHEHEADGLVVEETAAPARPAKARPRAAAAARKPAKPAATAKAAARKPARAARPSAKKAAKKTTAGRRAAAPKAAKPAKAMKAKAKAKPKAKAKTKPKAKAAKKKAATKKKGK